MRRRPSFSDELRSAYQLLLSANAVRSWLIVFTLMMEAVRSSETPVFLQESHAVTSQKSAFFYCPESPAWKPQFSHHLQHLLQWRVPVRVCGARNCLHTDCTFSWQLR
jgi:hypothetical protein